MAAGYSSLHVTPSLRIGFVMVISFLPLRLDRLIRDGDEATCCSSSDSVYIVYLYSNMVSLKILVASSAC